MPEGILASIVICTTGRVNLLQRCIDSIKPYIDENHEILVVDNSKDGSAKTISQNAGVRWVHESRPGSSWARNRGYQEARFNIILYIDDDCLADPAWCNQMLSPFQDAKIDVVTGSVLGSRVDLAIPCLIDQEYSFHRGWRPCRYEKSTGTSWSPFDIWRVGVGGSMAWRKSTLEKIQGFDIALGAGTIIGSCEDIDAFRRALIAGCTIYYQPKALIWHQHPEFYEDLKSMLNRYAVTLGAHAAKMVVEEQQWKGLLYLMNDWWWQVRWGWKLLWEREDKETAKMPALALLQQPGNSVVGFFRFIRYRNQLRQDPPQLILTKQKKQRKKQPGGKPQPSGLQQIHVDVEQPISNQILDRPARVLVRKNSIPVYSLYLEAGMRLRDSLNERLSQTEGLKTYIDDEFASLI